MSRKGGGGVSNLVLDAYRLVYAWGLNAFGELGLGNISAVLSLYRSEVYFAPLGDDDIRLQPARLRMTASGTLNALSCAAGSRHTIIIISTDTLIDTRQLISI